MIFITLGVTNFGFDRLLKVVDKILNNLGYEEELIVQTRKSKYAFKYKHVNYFDEVPLNKMINYIKNARIVITHCAPATIYLTYKYSKFQPLIVPRLRLYGEHVNNHQLHFAKYLSKNKIGEIIIDNETLENKIKKYLLLPKTKIKTLGNKTDKVNLIKELICYSNKITEDKNI